MTQTNPTHATTPAPRPAARRGKSSAAAWPMPFPPPARPTSPRGRRVAELLGLEWPDQVQPRAIAVAPPAPGEVVLIVGPSGGGKSTLLRQVVAPLGTRARRVDAWPLPDRPVIDLFDHLDVIAAMNLLGSVGLGEAWSYLRTPGELSDGQRFRLRLALALEDAGCERAEGGGQKAEEEAAGGPAVLVVDEFTAPLDRVTAAVVAHSLQKIVRRSAGRLAAVVATGHDDVERPLRPDRVVRCDYAEVMIEE